MEVRAVPVLRVSSRRSGPTLTVTVRTAPDARLGLSLQRFDPARQVWAASTSSTLAARVAG